MWHRSLTGLVFAVALCSAQHVQFGSLVNGSPIANPAIDSEGNLILLTGNVALGMCCGVGTRTVILLNRYLRDGSSRVIADTGIDGSEESPVVLAVDPQDRIYVGSIRKSTAAVVRFSPDGTQTRAESVLPFTRIAGIAFAPNGDPILVGGDSGPSIQVVRLDATTLNSVATRRLTGNAGFPRAITVDSSGAVYITGNAAARGFDTTPGAFRQGCGDCDWGGAFVTKLSPDLQAVVYSTLIGDTGVSGAVAIAVANDASVYIAGYVVGGSGESPFPTTVDAFQRRLNREPELWSSRGLVLGPATAFLSRLNADGTGLIASTLLGGSLSESIDGLVLDAKGRVIAHGVTQSHDFPATGIFEQRCGPDRRRLNSAQFLTRLDPLLQHVEKSITLSGVGSQGLPSGPARGSLLMVLGSSLAAVDLDRDNDFDIACVVSGASYKGLPAVTPGQLVTIFGRGLGPEALASFETGGPIPTLVAGTEVLFNGLRAPILAAVSNQLVVVVPLELQPNVRMQVKRNGEQIYERNFRLSSNAPDPLLRVTKSGQLIPSPESPYVLLADALNEDGTRNSAENPAAAGSVVTVFTTGLGALNSTTSEAGYGDGSTRPVQSFIVGTASVRIESAETTTLPGRTVGVSGVRFRVPSEGSGIVQFSIEPSYAGDNFVPTNFIYKR